MNAKEIELLIQDTTDYEEMALADLEPEVELVFCSCGQSFRHDELGASALLKKCHVCFSALQMELDEPRSGEETVRPEFVPASVAPADPTVDAPADTPEDSPADPTVDLPADMAPNQPSLTTEFISGAMLMAIGDASKSFVISLNGQEETFTYFMDPVNGSKARKLFLRKSWQFKELYWYRVFGAMSSSKGVVVTPCMVELKDGDSVILLGILETMCNRPRYDALVYYPKKKEVAIFRNFLERFRTMHLAVQFDRDELERETDRFLQKNRWFYDPNRGLLQTCKNPQMADSNLKAYWTKESRKKIQAEEAKEEVVVVAAAPPLSKKRGRQSTVPPNVAQVKKCMRPVKKAASVVIEAETSDSEDSAISFVVPPARQLPARSSQLHPAPEEPPCLLSVAPARAAVACMSTTSVNNGDVVVPLPAVSVPLRSADISFPTEVLTPTMPQMTDLAIQSNNSFVQQLGHAMPLEKDFTMFAGMVYDNMRNKIRVRELERRLEQHEEADERAKFQESMAAFFRR